LDEFLELDKNPPALSDDVIKTIEKDRAELAGDFCRACGYCMPCPSGIQIPTSARMSLLLRRSPYQGFLSDESRDSMELITKCTQCGQCKRHCPYQLDTPTLLKKNLKDYREFYAAHKK
jgi:predicted aldo/keto reductase-like oxidoreductase